MSFVYFQKKERKSHSSCVRAKENLDLVCEEKQFILNRCTVQRILSSDETVRAFTTWSRDFRARLASEARKVFCHSDFMNSTLIIRKNQAVISAWRNISALFVFSFFVLQLI